MSLELHAFLPASTVVSRASWQRAIDSLELPFALAPELNPASTSGYSPASIDGVASGCEIDTCSAADILSVFPHLADQVRGRESVISLRWGGDLKECGCAMAAAAGLAHAFGAIVYYPPDDMVYPSVAALVEEFRQCV